jgi:predicted N-acetyltransferase YhbS
MTPKPVTVRRSNLYTQVWATPMATLAPSYGISDIGLRKICRKRDIPCPGRGYWARRSHGHHVCQVPLPSPERDGLIAIMGNGLVPQPKAAEFMNIFDRALMVESTRPRITPHADPLVHPLILATKRAMRVGRDEWHRCTPDLSTGLDVTVGRSHVERALRIMEALITTLEKSGYRIRLGNREHGGTYVNVCGELIEISVIELLRVTEKHETQEREALHPHPPAERWMWKREVRLSGALCIELDPEQYTNRPGLRRRWKDGSKQRLEDCLNDVIVGLIRQAEGKRAQASVWHNWPAKNAAAALINEYRKLEAEHAAKIETALNNEASSWSEAKITRDYIGALEAKLAESTVPDSEHARIKSWIQRLRDRADKIDPLFGSGFDRIGIPEAQFGGHAIVRDALDEDYDQIRALIASSFLDVSGSGEKMADLVAALKKKRCFDTELSIVTATADRIIGYALFSNIGLRDLPGVCGVALAPVCVDEKYRRRSVATQMINHGLEVCRKLGKAFVFVQGDGKFYGRFGFREANDLGLHSPFATPHEQILALDMDGIPKNELTLEFPAPWVPLVP